MPTISTPSKIAATKGYGARVYFSGSTSDEREAVVKDVIRDTGAVLVPPYDHPDIILGQGTMALELEEQAKELIRKDPGLSVHHKPKHDIASGYRNDTDHTNGTHASSLESERGRLNAVIAPIGGGGMLSGIATYVHFEITFLFGTEFESSHMFREQENVPNPWTCLATLLLAPQEATLTSQEHSTRLALTSSALNPHSKAPMTPAVV